MWTSFQVVLFFRQLGVKVNSSACSDSGLCLQSHVSSSCYSVLDSPLYYSLGFPSGPAHPVSTPLAPAAASVPVSPDLPSISPRCLNKYLGYFILVSSSESALGFPCSTPLPRLVILLLFPGFPTLLLPWIPLRTCSPCFNPSRSSRSLRTWFPAVSPDLHSISPLCLNKYHGYFIPVSSSESALGFPCSTPRNK
ncbi:unnamed protein product [Coregonus sp. 'balchen']|nr:unnamed protein product [Coregonus sp. 'balchen']